MPIDRKHEEQLESVLAAYILQLEAGNDLDRQQLIEQHPEFAGELMQFFEQRDQLNLLANPFREFEVALHHAVGPGEQLTYVGNYELLEEVARGGMGLVYKARQITLDRIVAVKMIFAGKLANELEVQRFHSEAQAAASLKHPNIVSIHEVGQHEGWHYFSMDYVEGHDLSTILRLNLLPVRTAATYVRQMAQAIHYAHHQGILHRDLKPSNVLIDPQHQVHITDFGLSMRVEGDHALTQAGQILGTPSYMPPEQAQADRTLIGPSSDVYALGAILYECLTGRPPFRAESVIQTLHQVISSEAAPPRALNAVIPKDLETICLKCLEKEPHRRYSSAQALAQDLDRFLAGDPVVARPVGRAARATRWCRRNPAIAGLLVSIAISLILGTTASSYFAIMQARQFNQLRSEQEQTSALRLSIHDLEHLSRQMEQSLATDKEKLRQGEEQLFATYMQLARSAWRNDDIELSNYYLNQCPPSLRNIAWEDLKRKCYPNVLKLDGQNRFAISRDGKRLAAPSGDLIKIWDLESMQVIHSIPIVPREADVILAFNSDRTLLAFSQQQKLIIWDVIQEKVKTTLEFDDESTLTCIAFSPQTLMTTTTLRKLPKAPWRESKLIVWDLENIKPIAEFPHASTAAFNHDGRWLAIGGQLARGGEPDVPPQSGITVWSTADFNTPHLMIPGPLIGRPCFHPLSDELAFTGGASIVFWDIHTRNMVKQFTGEVSADQIAYSPDGKRLAYSGRTTTLADQPHVFRTYTWNTITRDKERTIPWFNNKITDLGFTPDGKYIVTADIEAVSLWDVTPPPDPTHVILNDIADMDVGSHDWPQWGGSKSRINSPFGRNIPTHWSVGSPPPNSKSRTSTGALTDWKKGRRPEGSKNIKWSMTLGSEAYGNPVVANGKIFVGTNNGAGYLERYPPEVDLGVLLCFEEATGNFLWQHSNEKLNTGRVHDWPQQGVCSTPVVDGDRLWYVSNRGEIVCLDTLGFYDDEDDGLDQRQWTDLFRVDGLLSRQIRSSRSNYLRFEDLPATLVSGFNNLGSVLPAHVALTQGHNPTTWTVAEATYVNREILRGETLFRIELSDNVVSVFCEGTDVSTPCSQPLFTLNDQLVEGLGTEKVVWGMKSELLQRGIELSDNPQVVTLEEGTFWSFSGVVDRVEQPFQIQLNDGQLLVRNLVPWKETADVVWTLNMMTELGVSQHNMANCSMLTAHGMLFVCTSNGVDEGHLSMPNPNAPSFLAVDRDTGKVVWSDNSPGSNVMHAQWASPSYGVFNGQAQVIFAGGDGWVYSFDPLGDGRGGAKLLWKFDGNPKTAVYHFSGVASTKNPIISFPAIYDGLVYIVLGDDPEHGEGDGHLWCIDPLKRLDGSDVSADLAVNENGELIPPRRTQAVDITKGERAVPNPDSAVVWHYSHVDQNGDGEYDLTEVFHRSLSTPVIKDDVLYVADFSGVFHCLNAKTGKLYWTYDLFAACWSSALIVEEKVYVANEDGDVSVFRHSADPRIAMKRVQNEDGRVDFIPYYANYEAKLLVQCSMESSVYMTPIVANNVMYIATRTALFAIESIEETPYESQVLKTSQ
jgi:serine/threonine protein kinase/outer membrane protein assembly factor BamB